MFINQLTFTRFVAAITVVFFHFAVYEPVWPFHLPQLEAISTLLKIGNASVLYFFVLSGFILTISHPERVTKINYRDFYWRRFARIYPVYFVSFILCVLLVKNRSWLEIFLNAFLLNAWKRDANQLNPAAWSLSSEVFFYCLFPVVIVWYARLKKHWLLVLIAIHIGLLYLIQQTYQGFSLQVYLPVPVSTAFIFLLGVLSGLLYLDYYSFFVRNQVWISLLFLLTFAIYCVAILYFKYNWFNGFWLFSGLFLTWILSVASLPADWRVTKVLTTHYAQLLGEISYSIFILQFPVMHLYNFFLRKVNIQLSPTIHFYSYIVLLIFSSYITYTMIEKPFRKKLTARRLQTYKNVA